MAALQGALPTALPFRHNVDEYIESFQVRFTHAGYLTPVQQARLLSHPNLKANSNA
jgi:hypothetical protein